uniref:Uncharacterized protein n=1 Tax=Anguilla anguilla TaxID=7936 RepID=A0A0E9QJ09_ANGAN
MNTDKMPKLKRNSWKQSKRTIWHRTTRPSAKS